MIRDQIVYGILDKKLRARLLREVDLSLEKAVQICKAAEMAKHRDWTWEENQETATVDSTEKRSCESRHRHPNERTAI